MASAGRRITTRQRWTPTPVQLQILDRIFDQETGTPSKQKIKDHITSELSQHGRISETNVYNWFQNRRLGLRGSNWGHYPTMLNQNKRRKLSHRMERRPSPAGIPLYQHNPAPRAEDLCMVGSASEDEHLSGKMGMPGCYDIYDRAEDYGMAG
ncbi:hypothetical protein V6N13_127850 [Hibiscus sabdariffa]